MKANPHPAFLECLIELGAGIEVASAGELKRALAAGCSPQNIVFAGPGKTDHELALAISIGLGEIHAESMGEVKRISQLATTRMATVALRVNPSIDIGGHAAMRMGGQSSPFGIDEDQLDDVIDFVDQTDSMELVGIHLNTGKQQLDVEAIIDQYRYAAMLAKRIGQRRGRPLAVVNLGGGLGVPYFPGQQPLAITQLARGLTKWIAWTHQDHWLANVQWVIEPGRYLVAESGLYVAQVVDQKTSRGEHFVVVDGGMHQHLAASGNFGQTIKRPFPLAVANRLSAPCQQQSTIVGPLCTPLDTLGRKVRIQNVQIGDLVVIFQSGAYAVTASPLDFLGHPHPKEIWLEGDGKCVRVLKPRRYDEVAAVDSSANLEGDR
jgi:diaminopimelate decarboxylase